MNKRLPYLFILFITCLYLIFPNNNPGTDSWYYAASVKYGKDLFRNHHLLYSAFGRLVYEVLSIFYKGADAFSVLRSINALSAGVSLFILYRLLLRFGQSDFTALTLTFLCASTFGFMRFATDAETYSLPLMFWLFSVWYLSGIQMKPIFAGCFAAAAILFHEIYIWWSVSAIVILFFYTSKKRRDGLKFTAPLLLVPAVYTAVYLLSGYENSPAEFIIGEYAKGNAGISMNLSAILLTGISFIRTFVQIHGYLPLLFEQYFGLLSVVSVLISALLAAGLYKGGLKISRRKTGDMHLVVYMFLPAFVLHLLFAFVSSGNAEFMSMLPFLMVLYAGSRFDFTFRNRLMFAVAGLFAWNLMFALIPASILNMNQVDEQADFWEKHAAGTCTGVWKDRPLVHNVLAYRRGFLVYDWLPITQPDSAEIMGLLKQGRTLYTDIGNPGTVFSRREILSRDRARLPEGLIKTPVDSFLNVYGKNYIYRITAKK